MLISFHKYLEKITEKTTQIMTKGLYYKTFYGRNLQIFVISSSVCPWQAYPD
jgi:hypothetical protein